MSSPSPTTPSVTTTPSGGITPSIVRTTVPLLVGVFVTWLTNVLGADIDTALAGALLTGGASWVYYVVARALEVYASPKWSYILGISKAPVYTSKEPPVNVAVRDEAGAVSLGLALAVAGLVLLVLGVVLGVQLLLWLGLALAVAGVVVMVVRSA